MPPSLYANLLNKGNATANANAGSSANGSVPGVISSEPVKYSFKKAKDESKEEKRAADGTSELPVMKS